METTCSNCIQAQVMLKQDRNKAMIKKFMFCCALSAVVFLLIIIFFYRSETSCECLPAIRKNCTV